MNIRDLSTLERTASWLEELITLCRPRGPLAGKDPALQRDVTRKAKALRTSLQKLRAALDDPDHQPAKEEDPMTQQPLGVRLYQQRCLYALARFISYGGRRADQVRAFLAGHRETYGEAALSALHELTMIDERSCLTVLRPAARKACRVLLGPAPESDEYARYWQLQGSEPPAHDQPPRDEEPDTAERAPPKKRTRKKKEG